MSTAHAPAPVRLLAATGLLGYGFTEEAFRAGLESGVDLIGVDAGSMDPGPYYLGAGVPFVSRAATRRDLGLIIEGGVRHGIPVVIGSAGGGGGHPHVAWTRDIIEEIAAERGLRFRMAIIDSEQDPRALEAALGEGRLEPLGPIGELDARTLRETTRVVAMMGVEPLQAALEAGADVVLAGRSSDAAIYAALPILRGHDPGLAWHAGKIIECGAAVVEPRAGADCVTGTVAGDHFTVTTPHPEKRCTRMRVAAHTLYENPSPYELKEPGILVDTRACAYEQADPKTVRVRGTRFETRPYTVKLEGVTEAGFRTLFVGGARDPDLVAGIDTFIATTRERVEREVRELGIGPEDYTLTVRVYGRDAVMGPREPVAHPQAHEVGIVADVIATDEETSRAVMAKARFLLLHGDFPGRKCISGNLAIPFSPSDLAAGPVYRFSVWHTMAVEDPLAPFPMRMVEVGGGARARRTGAA